MNITVNGTMVENRYNAASNLEDVLTGLTRTVVPDDHLVGAVIVNGRQYTELYPGQSREIPREKIQSLEVTTVPLQRLGEASLKDAAVFTRKIIENCKMTAESFRLYDETEAHEKYAALLDAVRSLIHFIGSVQTTFHWDFDKIRYRGEAIAARWTTFTNLIDELMRIQEEGDLILLADLIEYEMVPLFEDWANIFEENASHTSRAA